MNLNSRIAMAVALVTLASTPSWAVLCQKRNGILVSKSSCTGRLRAVDPASLGLVGPAGAPGAPGAPGAMGDPGPGARWALVDGDGTIRAQSGGIAVTRTGVGNFYVNFGSSLAAKTLSVTMGCTTASCPFFGTPTASVCGGGPAGSTCPVAVNNANNAWVFLSDTDNITAQDAAFYISAY